MKKRKIDESESSEFEYDCEGHIIGYPPHIRMTYNENFNLAVDPDDQDLVKEFIRLGVNFVNKKELDENEKVDVVVAVKQMENKNPDEYLIQFFYPSKIRISDSDLYNLRSYSVNRVNGEMFICFDEVSHKLTVTISISSRFQKSIRRAYTTIIVKNEKTIYINDDKLGHLNEGVIVKRRKKEH
jgi:hypothetical protein